MQNEITLNMNTSSVQYLCERDKHLAKVVKMVGPISYVPHAEDAYSFLVHEIIEQMLSVKAGAKIYCRLEAVCNGSITPEHIMELSNEQLKSIGTSTAKVGYIKGLTSAVLSGSLDFEQLQLLDDYAVIEQLTALRGIGNWTAKMYLIFVLNRDDVLPYEDAAFLQAYSWAYKTNDLTPTAVKERCRKWKPYSSIAARYMYRALDNGLTKNEFHLYK